MIKFKTLKFKNFLSIGDNLTEIDFAHSSSTLVVGHNGSGKSTLIDALSFALFNKPHRRIGKPQLVNSVNGKHCYVEVSFSIGKKQYKIVRGIKPSIFEIWVDGKMLNQDSHARDYQKLLETNILKLNHKSFHQVVVLGSSNFIPFMQLPSGTRRMVIEDLLDIGIFSKMNSLLKIEQSKLVDQLKDVEYQWKLVKEKMSLQTSHIDKLTKISQNNIDKLDKEIRDIKDQVKILVVDNEGLTKTYQDDYEKATIEDKKANDLRNQLDHFGKQINDNLKKVQKEQRFYENNKTCPSCQQVIGDDIRDQKLHDCGEKTDELTDGYEKLQESIVQSKVGLESTQKKLRELMTVNNQLSSNHTLINNFEKRVVELEKAKSDANTFDDLESAKEDLASMRGRLDGYVERKAEMGEEKYYNELAGELLKDTGIKTKIIRQYLPVMNKLINGYLNVLDFFISFELDENFDETIRSRHRDDFSYASFSEGEKSRINLALLFAWRQIAKMKNSTNTNLLILDEVFDSSLDNDGVENLLKIMKTLDEDTRVFVVTHKPDSFENIFDRKITASKRGNFTEYDYEMLKS